MPSCRFVLTRRRVLVVAALAAAAGARSALATSDAPAPERFAVHGQFTWVEQQVNDFADPYRGANSLTPARDRETVDATLYLGWRLGPGLEAWLSPELDQGFGLDDTLGVAGFPSGEAYKVGRARPYLRLPRAFLRATFGSTEPTQPVAAGLMQLAGAQPADHVTVTIGKFSVTDIFDASAYAHDPRGDFLNWTAIDAGSFDYAADAWGYTVGAAVEAYHGNWVVRGGAFALSNVPNSAHLTPGARQFELVAEFEHDHQVRERPGRLLVTTYQNRARMARLSDLTRALQWPGPLDVEAARAFRSRTGASLLFEQSVARDVTLFGRVGAASGNVEAYEFTDIDRASAVGVSLAGTAWGRARDSAGAVLMDNRISTDRQAFLDAGGLGILVGDGRLPHPGAESIVEGYYRWALVGESHLTLDWQRVRNPAYNRDRGPAAIVALRLHAQF